MKLSMLFLNLLALLLTAPVVIAMQAENATEPPTDAKTAASPAPIAAATNAETNGVEAIPASDRDQRIREVVGYLASDECGGRRVGTEGCNLAAAYLEEQFKAIGLEPARGSRGFRQGFSVTKGIAVSGEPLVELFGNSLIADEHYRVASFSGSGKCENVRLVFAGYGIIALELDWNDYSGIDVEGAAVVILRGEPQEHDPQSKFGGEQITVYSDLRRKAATARDLGARALLVLNNPIFDPDDELPEVRPTYSGASFDVPVIHLRRSELSSAIVSATGLRWNELVQVMDLDYLPQSCKLSAGGFSIDLAVEKDLVTGFNLIGVIPGSDPELANEYVVLGAHYDHLGLGGPESSAKDRYGEIHHGADDNASGVAAVLELARWAKANPNQTKRSLIVSLFSAEEIGLIGSSAMAKTPPVPHEQIYAMFNFDMVGRLRDDKLFLGGGGTALEFDALFAGMAEQHGLSIAEDRSGIGGSDHLSFLRYDNPVLFFLTGPHSDYHTPDDTADKLDYAGLERVLDFSGEMLARLLTNPASLTFERPPGSPDRPSRKQAIKVSMGTVPSFESSNEPGYVMSDVVAGGPAELAGMQGGDRIIKIRDRKIADIYDFMYALEDVNPGDTVLVVLVRAGKELKLEVTLHAKNIER